MKPTSLALCAYRISRAAAAVLVMAALCAAVLLPRAASAAGYLYSGKRKNVNCGVLMLENSPDWSQPLAAFPDGVGNIFSLLDYLVDLKPAGWSLDNPYASVDAQGRKYDKSDPRFWQVRLQTARDLTRMNVLYLVAKGNVQLRDVDREKLRRFVDSGGVLWIDNWDPNRLLSFAPLGDGGANPGTFFIPNLYFTRGGMGGYDVPWSRHHPLLTLPYWLDDQEITMLGFNWGACGVHPGYDVGGATGWESIGAPPITSDVLYPIVAKNDGSAPSVAANTYGSGRVVATANFVGRGCFLPYPNCLPSLKFAYNVLAWSSCWTDLRKDPRRSGRSIDTVGGSSLVNIWTLPNTPPSGESGAIVYKNIAYYSSGNTLYAMDVMPMEDLDNDGNPDDGLQDMGPSTTGVDKVWEWSPHDGSTLSSPTVVTLPDPKQANKTVEAVLVSSSAGVVYMLDAFPHDANGVLNQDGTTKIITSFPTRPVDNPTPPICENGWIYSVSGDGRLFAYNPTLDSWNAAHQDPNNPPAQWAVPDTTISQATYSTLKSGPVFGYVTATNSQAVTGMVYWFVSAPQLPLDPNNPSSVQEQNDYVYGVPVCVKNDRLKLRGADDARTTCEFATSYPDLRISQTLPDPVIKWTCSDTGFSFDLNNVQANMGLSNGVPTPHYGSFVLKANKPIPADLVVYADYSIAYGLVGNLIIQPMPRVRSALQPSCITSNSGGGTAGAVPKTEVAAMPALGPDNVLFLTGKRAATDYGSGGSIYAIKNDGSSGQSTKWSYMLHGGVAAELLNGLTNAPLPIPGLLTRKPLSANPNELAAITLQSPQSYSSPVVWGDKLFVTVSSSPSGGSGHVGVGTARGGALLCLKATSDFVIRIMENSGVDEDGKPIKHPKQLWDTTTGRAIQVKIWQPNLMCGPTGFGVSMEAVAVPGNMIDRDKGTITFTAFDRIKMKGGIGALQDTNMFSPSLPVWVLLDEQEIPIDWITWGPTNNLAAQLGVTMPQASSDSVDLSSWNNLLWYYAPPNCSGIHSSPVLIGNCVYFVTDDGILYSVDCETGETLGGPIDTDADAHKDFVYWEEPVEMTPGGGPTPYSASDSLHVSPSGSNGVLLVPGPHGLAAYANPSTLVADSNRLVEVDSAGNVTWSLDSVHVPAAVPAVKGNSSTNPLPRREVPVNKPTRARYMETGQIMLVNTGANMVCKTDKAGNVGVQQVMTLSNTQGWIKMMYDRFDDPKNLLRPGQPKTLSSPSDAISWMEYEPGSGNQALVMHCLIADSGNSRVLDLVYRFNNTGQLMNTAREDEYGYFLPELNWASDTETKGEKYIFECIQVVPDAPKNQGDSAKQSVWAAISNYRSDPTVPNPQGLGGAIVKINYRERNSTNQWDYMATDSGHIVAGCDKYDAGGVAEPLAGPRFFQASNEAAGTFLLVCDNHGVLKIGPLGPDLPGLAASLTDDAYRNMDRDPTVAVHAFGAPLLASSAQEMPNHKWLIANSYSGTDKQGVAKFQGEVFEYDPSKTAITWSSPKLTAKYQVDPNTGIRVFMGFEQEMGVSYNLQQPRCAFRQF